MWLLMQYPALCWNTAINNQRLQKIPDPSLGSAVQKERVCVPHHSQLCAPRWTHSTRHTETQSSLRPGQLTDPGADPSPHPRSVCHTGSVPPWAPSSYSHLPDLSIWAVSLKHFRHWPCFWFLPLLCDTPGVNSSIPHPLLPHSEAWW